MDIIMQGGMWPGTIDTAENYIKHDFVENVIISTWTSEFKPNNERTEGIHIVYQKIPENPGQGNINLQILSSREGLRLSELSDTMIAAKTRTDQHISDDSLIQMNEIFSRHDHGSVKRFFDGSVYPLSHIFVLGLQTKFPFQTQDHIFWGFRRDLIQLFNCPLNQEPVTGQYGKPEWGNHAQRDVGLDFTKHLRMPIWLTGHYYARGYSVIYKMLENYKDYLCDGAKHQSASMDVYNAMIPYFFKPFPRVDIWWEKMGHDYPYAMYEQQGEINTDNWPENL